jgi:hypothetical protein
MADAMAGLGDILLMAVARADELPILHGIAGPRLSRTVGPAERISLPTYAPDDALPNILVWVEMVGADLHVAQSHSSCAVDQLLQAFPGIGSLLHITLLSYLV